MVLAGKDVTNEPLGVRRQLLQERVLAELGEPIRESPELDASLPDLISSVKAHGLEGLVAKRRDSTQVRHPSGECGDAVRFSRGHSGGNEVGHGQHHPPADMRPLPSPLGYALAPILRALS